MKNAIIILFTILISTSAFTQNLSTYRIYGEITTVGNEVYKGYITWNGNKNYWIDFFQASKLYNPYSAYFKRNDGVIFRSNNKEYTKPSTHIFCCRFGNIKTIRLTGENQILLQLKNGEGITLAKGNYSDINTQVEITTPTEIIPLKWERISEVHFMGADSNCIAPENYRTAGIVQSPQGIYKGLIYWNYSKEQSPEENNNINQHLNKIQKISIATGSRGNEIFELITLENSKKALYKKTDILPPMEDILIDMPNIGSVIVPWSQFKGLTIVPLSELNLLSYDDFQTPQPIIGEVITRTDQVFRGELAYDLDESYNFETLDGKNDNIVYRIPFQYIRTIEPKNYKYSFVTLRNGSEISLGETCDVDQDNSGIIILNEKQNPVYIQWSQVKKITLQ